MVRKWSTAGILLGAVAVLAPVLGVFGLASDSVESQGSSVQSATFTPPGHDLQAARVESLSACADALYGDGPFTAAIDSQTVDLNTPSGFVAGQPDWFCLRNAGTETGRLVVTFTNVLETEVGTCEESEAEAGDTTCATGPSDDQGELTSVLGFNIHAGFGEGFSTSCPSRFGPWVVLVSGLPMDDDLAPGEVCAIKLDLAITGDDTQRLIAQTDHVQWDIVFTLEDIPA